MREEGSEGARGFVSQNKMLDEMIVKKMILNKMVLDKMILNKRF